MISEPEENMIYAQYIHNLCTIYEYIEYMHNICTIYAQYSYNLVIMYNLFMLFQNQHNLKSQRTQMQTMMLGISGQCHTMRQLCPKLHKLCHDDPDQDQNMIKI